MIGKKLQEQEMCQHGFKPCKQQIEMCKKVEEKRKKRNCCSRTPIQSIYYFCLSREISQKDCKYCELENGDCKFRKKDKDSIYVCENGKARYDY